MQWLQMCFTYLPHWGQGLIPCALFLPLWLSTIVTSAGGGSHRSQHCLQTPWQDLSDKSWLDFSHYSNYSQLSWNIVTLFSLNFAANLKNFRASNGMSIGGFQWYYSVCLTNFLVISEPTMSDLGLSGRQSHPISDHFYSQKESEILGDLLRIHLGMLDLCVIGGQGLIRCADFLLQNLWFCIMIVYLRWLRGAEPWMRKLFQNSVVTFAWTFMAGLALVTCSRFKLLSMFWHWELASEPTMFDMGFFCTIPGRSLLVFFCTMSYIWTF